MISHSGVSNSLIISSLSLSLWLWFLRFHLIIAELTTVTFLWLNPLLLLVINCWFSIVLLVSLFIKSMINSGFLETILNSISTISSCCCCCCCCSLFFKLSSINSLYSSMIFNLPSHNLTAIGILWSVLLGNINGDGISVALSRKSGVITYWQENGFDNTGIVKVAIS